MPAPYPPRNRQPLNREPQRPWGRGVEETGRQEKPGPQASPPGRLAPCWAPAGLTRFAAAPSGAVTLTSPTCTINGFRDVMVWIPLLWKLKIPPPLCCCQPAGKAIPEGGWGLGTQLNAGRLLSWMTTSVEGDLPGDASCHLASRLVF